MSIVSTVRGSLGLKVSLKLAVLLVALTAIAAVILLTTQTRQLEELTLEKAKVAAAIGARQYGDFFDNAIDGGQATVADVFDRNYVEIKGYEFSGKPKFHTRYDAAQVLARNRTKRIFGDSVGIDAAKNRECSIVQVYQRDTGETMWDVSSL